MSCSLLELSRHYIGFAPQSIANIFPNQERAVKYLIALTLAAVPVTAHQPSADDLLRVYAGGGSGHGWLQMKDTAGAVTHECVSVEHGRIVDWAVKRLHQMAKSTAI